MKELKILIGISASGKSTWAKEFVAKNDRWCIVSRDDFRYAWQNRGVVENKLEEIITKMIEHSIETLINNGFNVIYDATNLKVKYINKITSIVRHTAKVTYQIFDVPKDVAIERDSKRERTVGKQVIENQYKDYLVLIDSFDFKPINPVTKKYVQPTFDPNKKDAIIVDLDGTLAHTSGNRGWYDYDKVHLDVVDEGVMRMLSYAWDQDETIIVVSGREDSCKEITKKWLDDNEIYWNEIHMRKTGDKRSDNIVKEEIFWNEIEPKYNVIAVFDDRDSVVKMWRSLGLKCFQVDYGNF